VTDSTASVRRRGSCVGFTLIELLLSISIIVVLIALLLPALESAVQTAKQTECLTRVRAWGQQSIVFEVDQGHLPMGVLGYQDDHDSLAPYAPRGQKLRQDAVLAPTPRGYWRKGSSQSVNPTTGLAVGGDYNAMVYPAGTLVFFGYLTNVGQAYCPDQTVFGNTAGRRIRRQMNLPDGLDDWQAVVDLAATHASPLNLSQVNYRIGYTNYLFKNREISGGDVTLDRGDEFEKWTAAWPYDGQAPRGLNTSMLAARRLQEGYTPMLFSCANDRIHTSGKKSHGLRGVNGTMFDGSSRWIGLDELGRIAEAGTVDGETILGRNGSPASPEDPEWLENTQKDGPAHARASEMQWLVHWGTLRLSGR
jgi:type II secretory pathway pseudopilin PulG